MPDPRLIGRAFIVILCLWHLLAISLIQLPLSTAFGDLHHRIFSKYLALTGTWQHWGMFKSRPYIQTLDISLRAYPLQNESAQAGGQATTQRAGATVEFGPVLPDFHAIGDSMRLQYLFLMGVTGLSDFLGDYLTRTCRKVEETFHWKPQAMGIVAEYGYTQAFSAAVADNRPLTRYELEYKRIACP